MPESHPGSNAGSDIGSDAELLKVCQATVHAFRSGRPQLGRHIFYAAVARLVGAHPIRVPVDFTEFNSAVQREADLVIAEASRLTRRAAS